MLTINNLAQRAEVKPLTFEEENKLIMALNMALPEEFSSTITLLQRFINEYENYRDYFEAVGGWHGLELLKVQRETALIKLKLK